MSSRVSRLAYDRVIERRRAVALAHQFREAKSLSIRRQDRGGVREAEITLYLRDELLTYLMDRRARGLPADPTDHVFGTATGNRRTGSLP